MPFLTRRRRRAVALAVGPALEALDRSLDQLDDASDKHDAAVADLTRVLGDQHP